MPFLSFRVRHRYVYFLLSASLLFVGYHFVPSVHTCHSRLHWTYEEHSTTAWCDKPEFSVVCWPGSKYSKQVGTEILCRTPNHRPIKIVVVPKVERQRCIAEMGWLAAYDSEAKDCYCDYHSVEQHGLCLMTDEACQSLKGSLAFAIDLGSGLVDQCRCPAGFAFDATCDAP
jgi:hypothetical protein